MREEALIPNFPVLSSDLPHPSSWFYYHSTRGMFIWRLQREGRRDIPKAVSKVRAFLLRESNSHICPLCLARETLFTVLPINQVLYASTHQRQNCSSLKKDQITLSCVTCIWNKFTHRFILRTDNLWNCGLLPWERERYRDGELYQGSAERRGTRFGEFCYCSCLPLLPELAHNIHATWGPSFSQAMYILSILFPNPIYGVMQAGRRLGKLRSPFVTVTVS